MRENDVPLGLPDFTRVSHMFHTNSAVYGRPLRLEPLSPDQSYNQGPRLFTGRTSAHMNQEVIQDPTKIPESTHRSPSPDFGSDEEPSIYPYPYVSHHRQPRFSETISFQFTDTVPTKTDKLSPAGQAWWEYRKLLNTFQGCNATYVASSIQNPHKVEIWVSMYIHLLELR